MPRLRKALGFGVIVAALGFALRPTYAGVRLEDDLALRCLFTLRGPVAPPADVVVVSIDKASSEQLGLPTEPWPPPRQLHASVIRELDRRGTSAIVMDVFFKVRRTPAEDDDLAGAIAASGKVTLFENIERVTVGGSDVVQRRTPIRQLRDAAAATAAFPLPKGDVVNSFWTFFDATGETAATLPAVALQIHGLPYLGLLTSLLRQSGLSELPDLSAGNGRADDTRRLMDGLRRALAARPDVAARALTILERGDMEGLTPSAGAVLSALVRLYAGNDTYYLNFYGGAGRIRTIPINELLGGGEGRRLGVENAVVFVGEGASELVVRTEQQDTYRTVYSVNGVDISGAEIAATAFANLLTNRMLRRVSFRLDWAVLICFGLIAGMAARLLPGLYGAGAVLALGFIHYAAAQYCFTSRSLLIPVGIPLFVQVPLTIFAAIAFRYRDVRKQVAREVDPDAPPQVVYGACLATDIENYTAASSEMEPRALALLMSEYFKTLALLVANRHGLVLGRAGDSAMCVWTGSPRDSRMSRFLHTLGARQRRDRRARGDACRVALDLRDTIARFNSRHAIPLRTRIGLHAGSIALGPVGGEYHVIGDVPNIASRIQALNKQLGTTVLASAAIVDGDPDLQIRALGRFTLAGVPGELSVFEILGLAATADAGTRDLVVRFGAALAAYEKDDLPSASALFTALAAAYPADGPTRYYVRRCASAAAAAPSSQGPVMTVDGQ